MNYYHFADFLMLFAITHKKRPYPSGQQKMGGATGCWAILSYS